MPKFTKIYNIKLPGKSIHQVHGRPTKLKGWSGFEFFTHKESDWSIREFNTGLRLGSGKTEALAKTRAKLYLAENVGTDKKSLKQWIESLETINQDLQND